MKKICGQYAQQLFNDYNRSEGDQKEGFKLTIESLGLPVDEKLSVAAITKKMMG